MNRILKRPMFRMGGAAEGITSGLDKPRQQYAPGGDVEEQFSRTRALFEKQGLMDKPLTGRQELSRFLIPFGLNFATATPRGGGFSGLLASAAGAAKDPVTDLFARRDEAAKDRKELDQAILGDVIDRDFRRTQQTELLKAEKEEQIRELQNNIDVEKQKGINANNELIKEQENAMALLQEEYRLIEESGAGGKQFDIGLHAKIANLVKSFDDEKLKLTDERAQIMTDIGDLGMGTADQNNRIKQIDVRLKSIADIRADILNQASLIEKIGTLEQTDQLNNIIDANMAKGMEYEEAFKAALEQFKFLQKMADGGRAGYQMGGPAEPIKEEDSPVQELSYQELRTRLPSTISDQVVQLIANSKQALLDFAEIRTQQDVDQFNQLYDVTLTLPQEG
jgi:hypothetical protein